MSAIKVLWLRQIKRFYRSRSRLIGTFATPLLYLLAFGFGFGSIYSLAGQGNYLQFLVPGIVGMSILFASVMSGIEIIWDREFGFLKEILVAPVPRLNIMIGRTLGGASVAMIQGCLFLILSLFFGYKFVAPLYLPIVLLFMLLVSLFFTGLGTAIASLLDDMQGFQLIMNFLIMPTFFLSGALFPIDTAPKAIQILSKFNPLSYGVNGIRTLLEGSTTSVLFNLVVLAFLAIVMLIVGAKLFSKMKA